MKVNHKVTEKYQVLVEIENQAEEKAIRELIGLQGPNEAFAVLPHRESESVCWVFSDTHDGYVNRWTMDSSAPKGKLWFHLRPMIHILAFKTTAILFICQPHLQLPQPRTEASLDCHRRFDKGGSARKYYAK
ncbi:hypothetical protein CEXT_648601 [Caerostris extrusa]|uniref:Uncharacterized protein n=1 Tax=Caerostris extrusa TaxID=172846 RepID=A0AAV4N8H5_CAEEX|nr:hypothetical protein CEXT_648601 [Caerostris extrusa]